MNTASDGQQLIETAKIFADREIRPFARDFDAMEMFPRSLIGKMEIGRAHV